MTEPRGERGRQGAAPLGGRWEIERDIEIARDGIDNFAGDGSSEMEAFERIASAARSAPDLLEALVECAADLAELAAVFAAKGNDTSYEQRHLEAADAAIAKARGEQ